MATLYMRLRDHIGSPLWLDFHSGYMNYIDQPHYAMRTDQHNDQLRINTIDWLEWATLERYST